MPYIDKWRPYDLKVRGTLDKLWLSPLLECKYHKAGNLESLGASFKSSDEGTWQIKSHLQLNIVHLLLDIATVPER